MQKKQQEKKSKHCTAKSAAGLNQEVQIKQEIKPEPKKAASLQQGVVQIKQEVVISPKAKPKRKREQRADLRVVDRCDGSDDVTVLRSSPKARCNDTNGEVHHGDNVVSCPLLLLAPLHCRH